MSNRPLRAAGFVAAGLLAVPVWALSPVASATAPPSPPILQTDAVGPACPRPASEAAQPPLPGAALRPALDAAWQRAAAASAAAQMRAQAEVERSTAAAVWPAPPALSLGLRSDRLQRDQGAREVELGVALPLWQAGERGARADVATTAVALAEAAGAAARLELAGAVREAAWAGAMRCAELAAAAEQARTLERLADDVDRFVAAGEAAPADALLARAELQAAHALHAESTLRVHEAALQWRALTGLPELPVVVHDARTDDTDAVRAAPLPGAHPQSRLARLAVETARLRATLVRATPRAAPELSLGLRRSQPGHGQPHDDSLFVGLRVPLGAGAPQVARAAAAQAELDHAEATERELHARLDAAQAVAQRALASARVQLDAEATRARLLRERATLIERAWRAGEAPLAELLRASTAAAQAEATLARQRAGLGLARDRLQQTLGVQP